MDRVILVHEVFHSLNVTKNPIMMLKLDILKSYDKIRWKFMREMLKSYGFNRGWIEWTMNMTSSTFFSILLNGSSTKTFIPSWLIPQGDPLSPFMFILIVKGLICMIKVMVERDEIKVLKLHTRENKQTHQQICSRYDVDGSPICSRGESFHEMYDYVL